MNSDKSKINNDELIKKSGEVLKKGLVYYHQIKKIMVNTPLQIRIVNIIVPFIITYIFTYLYFNLTLSITFAILTFLIIFLLSQMSAFIFIILYIVSVVNEYNRLQQTIGQPIKQTDIVNGTGPWICNTQSLTIPHGSLSQDLNGGYFTYSFWLYIKDTNYSNTPGYGYRYNEWKSIFYRGTQAPEYKNLLQYPGFWLSPKLNNLIIVFQEGAIVERIELINIPINNWFNISCIVETKSVSLYINGLLDRVLSLNQNIKIMNNYDLFITSDLNLSTSNPQIGGFDGSLAELIFLNYALTPSEVYNSYKYYLAIINKYQNKINKNTYSTSSLITNSDYNEMCKDSCSK